MSRYVIFALAALAACSGPDDKTDSGGTGLTPTDCPDGFYDGPIVITEYTVSCDASDVARYYVVTDGWTGHGRVFSQETGNPETPYAQYSDQHDLMSYEFDTCQFWDHLETVLTTSATLDAATPNVSTVFSCDGHLDPTGAAVMSYAAQVDDIDGAPADCVAWGENPQGMIDDEFDRVNDPDFDLSVCEIGVAAR